MNADQAHDDKTNRRRDDLVLDRPDVQRGIKHAWFAQEIACILEQVVRDPATFAAQAGVRAGDLRRLLAGEDLDRVSVDTLLRVVIQGRLQLQVSTFGRPST